MSSSINTKKHKVVERIHEYVSMDCWGYRIVCSCGKNVTGWTPQEVEKAYDEHTRTGRIAKTKGR